MWWVNLPVMRKEMIYDDAPDFDTIINDLKELTVFLQVSI